MTTARSFAFTSASASAATSSLRRHAVALSLLAVLAALGLTSTGARAQTHDHGAMAQADAASAPAALPWVAGEIRKIEAAQGRLTIRHADIPNLDMPGMTMVFKLKPGLLSPAQLAAMKVGDRLEFQAEEPQGQLTLTALRPASAKPAGGTAASAAPASEAEPAHQH